MNFMKTRTTEVDNSTLAITHNDRVCFDFHDRNVEISCYHLLSNYLQLCFNWKWNRNTLDVPKENKTNKSFWRTLLGVCL